MDPKPRSLATSALSIRLRHHARPILEDVELHVAPGETAGLVGPSGSGKTTLLHTLAGLIPWHRSAEVQGAIRLDGEEIGDLDPGQRARLLATALDRPEVQLFLPTPAHELEAARRLRGGPGADGNLVELLGIGPLLHRPVTSLSSGERQRVLLAAVFSATGCPVLLDEPTTHLDPGGIEATVHLVQAHAAVGGSSVLCEHSGWRLARAVGPWYGIREGKLHPAEAPSPPPLPPPRHTPGGRVLLATAGLTVRRGGRNLVEGGTFELHEGEIVVLRGPNGAGKSSLARVLAGLARPAGGRVLRTGPVHLLTPSADLQLLATTVEAEVRSTGASPRESARVLRRHGLEHLASRAPWTLSRGERQRLVHAVFDLLRPSVMILDEPAQGLDGADLASLVELLHRRAKRGRAYLLISHRRELAAAAHRTLVLSGGRLLEAGP